MMEKETNCELHKTDEVHVMEHERGKSSNVAVENMLKSQLQQLKEQSVEVEKKSAARLQGKFCTGESDVTIFVNKFH